MTSIDGIGLDRASFALAAFPGAGGPATEGSFESQRFVCLTGTGCPPEEFAASARGLAMQGRGVILQSDRADALEAGAEAMPGRRPLLYAPRADQEELVGLASGLGLPVAVSARTPDELMALADRASSAECADVVLAPAVTCMKDCLETMVLLRRRTDLPAMVRLGSGEYAVSMGAVAAMRGCDIVVVDYLPPAACRVLDEIMASYSGRA